MVVCFRRNVARLLECAGRCIFLCALGSGGVLDSSPGVGLRACLPAKIGFLYGSYPDIF